MAMTIGEPWVKYVMMIILCIYMYGAMMLKYVAGAQSLQQGLAFLFTGNMYQWNEYYVYCISLCIFWTMAWVCCFGDIENSKWL